MFFTTDDQLVPQDTNTQGDLYDARIGGGFASATTSGCEADTCQALGEEPMLPVSGGSETAKAGENVIASTPTQKSKGKTTKTKKKKQKRRKKKPKAKKAKKSVRAAWRTKRGAGR